MSPRLLFSDLEFCVHAPVSVSGYISLGPGPEALTPNPQPKRLSLKFGDQLGLIEGTGALEHTTAGS